MAVIKGGILIELNSWLKAVKSLEVVCVCVCVNNMQKKNS